MGITGTPDGTPIKVGPGVGDIFPDTLLALGIVSALYESRSSGVGQFVDVAMYDAILSLCERIVYQYSYDGTIPKPEGNQHPLLSPFETPWVSWRLGLLDSDQGLVGPVCIVERGFELRGWDVAEVAV